MRQPLSEQERRARQYRTEAAYRRIGDHYMPWTKYLPIPAPLLALGPVLVVIAMCFLSVCGAGPWALTGSVAMAAFGFAADLRCARRSVMNRPARQRVAWLAGELLGAAVGVVLVSLFSWQWALRGLGWVLVNVGIWVTVGDSLILGSLLIFPLPKPEPEPASVQE